jgi:DNA repair photolyase
MIVKEVYAKTILSKSKISDYSINPYIGCEHGCTYCYARFMRRYTGHREAWGEFVDVKINAARLLRHEIGKKRIGRVWVSGVCDPYQPLEKRYRLTKKSLRILLDHGWPVTIQTKSPLVLRDIELLGEFGDMEAGFTITTADERIRRIFELNSPPVKARIEALERLHDVGIKTYAMIAPLLPKAEELPTQLRGKADYVLIDRMNYHYADWVYRKHRLEHAMASDFFAQKKIELADACRREEIPYQVLY